MSEFHRFLRSMSERPTPVGGWIDPISGRPAPEEWAEEVWEDNPLKRVRGRPVDELDQSSDEYKARCIYPKMSLQELLDEFDGDLENALMAKGFDLHMKGTEKVQEIDAASEAG